LQHQNSEVMSTVINGFFSTVMTSELQVDVKTM